MLHDGAGGNLVDSLALKTETLHDSAQRRGQHLLISHFPVGAVAAGKRNAHTPNDRDASRIRSNQHIAASEDLKRRIMNLPASI
jgi:hypothetical protein